MERIKKFLVIFIMVISTGLLAQDNSINTVRKGRLFLDASTNGGLRFSKTTVEFNGVAVNESDASQFSLNGSIGYTFLDNFVAGLNVGIASGISESTTDFNDVENRGRSLGAGPFIAYYFKLGNEKVRPYVRANAQFGVTRSKSEILSFTMDSGAPSIQNSEDKRNRSQWGIGAGIAYFINDHISVNGELAYDAITSNDSDDDIKSKFSNIGLNFGFSIFL
jgi:opacity protein-like surface antigen